MSLDTILDHAHGREWQHVLEGKYIIGLEAYDAWINVLEKRNADPQGNAFNALVVSDAREFAMKFLHDLTIKWAGTNIVERGVRKLASDALKHYVIVVDALVELRELFPFPNGGDPSNEENASIAVHLLNKAKDAETEGVKCLDTLHNFMKNYYAEKWVN